MKILQFFPYFTFIHCVYLQEIEKNTSYPSKFPFFSKLIVPGKLNLTHYYQKICGGSLIHPQWILTAGHCLPDGNKILRSSSTIFIGNIYVTPPLLRSRTSRRKIIEMHRHPDFKEDSENFNKTLNDVALLKLDRAFKLSETVQTIRLSILPPICDAVFIVGGGLTKDFPIKDGAIKVVERNRNARKTVFYATGDKNAGDIGAPVICARVLPPLQVGVLSGTESINSRNYHVIERVDLFISFIKQYVPVDESTKYLEPKQGQQERSESKTTKSSSAVFYLYIYLLCLCNV